MPLLYRIMALVFMLAPICAAPAHAQTPEQRFALVIGNTEYKAGQLPTAANDAGLIAETLRTAGFDVAGARDLDQDTLRRSLREFVDKVSAAGPQAVSFIYLAGYGLQFEGENYILPIDATIANAEDIPLEAIRISDFTRPLAATSGGVKIVVVDAARQSPFSPGGAPLASGLGLIDPDAGMLIAFNTAPGSVAPIENGPYGAFAQALAEMIGTGSVGLDDVFARVRLRVNETTGGVAVPWYASQITQPFLFTEPTPDAPPPQQVASVMDLQSQSIQRFPDDQEAYVAALERDTIEGYQDFIAAFPDSPHVKRIRALIAVRREALLWRRVLAINTREAYWSYLNRYPQGAHVADCERRLSHIAADYDPPPSFVPMAFADVPPPPPDEVVYLAQPQIVFDDPVFVPPPPLPVFFCPPRPVEFVRLPPPPRPVGAFFLPRPEIAFFSGPKPWVRPPTFVVAPPRPPVQQITINNTTIINNTRPAGVGVGLVSPALPAVVVSRANSGALRVPPPAPPVMVPAVHATISTPGRPGAAVSTQPHPGVSVLGTTVALPPRVHTVATTPTAPRIPGTPPAGPHPPVPNTAATTPNAPHVPGTPPAGPHLPVPNTAATTPTAPHVPGMPPAGPQPPVPNTAATTPVAPHVPGTPPTGPHPPVPNTAVTTPVAPHVPGTPPAGPHPPVPNTAATTPIAPHVPGTPPAGPHPPVPNTAATTPITPHVPGTPPAGPLPPVPNTATTTPVAPHLPGQPPAGPHPPVPNTATTTPVAPHMPGPPHDHAVTPPAATFAPPPAHQGPPPPPPAHQGPAAGVHEPPPIMHNPPPPAPHIAAPSPPPPVHQAPPPPPPVHQAPPPPPPAAVHPAPPPVVQQHVAPPPPVQHIAPPPPPAQHAPPPAPGRRCTMENGREVCR